MESENLIGLVTGSLFIATCVLLVYCGKQKIWLEELNKLLETAYMDIASMQKEMNQKSADEGESEKLIVLKENGMKLKDLIKEYGDYEVTIGLMNLLKEPKRKLKYIQQGLGKLDDKNLTKAIEKLEGCCEDCEIFGSNQSEFDKDMTGIHMSMAIKEVLEILKKLKEDEINDETKLLQEKI